MTNPERAQCLQDDEEQHRPGQTSLEYQVSFVALSALVGSILPLSHIHPYQQEQKCHCLPIRLYLAQNDRA